MLFKVEFPDNKLVRVAEPRYIHLADDHDKEAKTFADCETLEEVIEMVDFNTDEKITVDSGCELTVQAQQLFKIKITNESDFEPPFSVDFRLTSWKAANELDSLEFVDKFPDSHYGFDLLNLAEDDDAVEKTPNSVGTSWDDDDPDHFERQLAINVPTDFLPKKFGSPVYLVVRIYRHATFYTQAFRVNVTLGSKIITQPEAVYEHELVFNNIDDFRIPKYVWDYKVNVGRFLCNMLTESVSDKTDFFSPILLDEIVHLQIVPTNFDRAFYGKKVNFRIGFATGVDSDALERFQEGSTRLLQADFDETPSVEYVRSYEYGLLHFSVDWKHADDPKQCFEIALKFNVPTEELFKSGKPKPLKLAVRVAYENTIIDESEACVFVYPESVTPKDKEETISEYKNIREKTTFTCPKPIQMVVFLNIYQDMRRTDLVYVPCFFHNLDRNSFYSQILEILNTFNNYSSTPMKLGDIQELWLDRTPLINDSKKDFEPPEFKIDNKSVFDVKFRLNRVKDKSIPKELLENEKLQQAIKNTDLGMKTVARVHIKIAHENGIIQASLDKADRFSHTFKAPKLG